MPIPYSPRRKNKWISPYLSEPMGIQHPMYSNWIICRLLSQFRSEIFPTFDIHSGQSIFLLLEGGRRAIAGAVVVRIADFLFDRLRGFSDIFATFRQSIPLPFAYKHRSCARPRPTVCACEERKETDKSRGSKVHRQRRRQ